jgi:acyl-CoA hydrolase
MKERTVGKSRVEIAQLMMPQHANPSGNVHGGDIMRLVDQAGYTAAARHAHTNVVTAGIDRLDFLSSVYVGNVVFLKASVNYVSRSSMEVGVRVEAECLETGVRTHTATAFLTFVALDEKDEPTAVPRLVPETDVEKRRFEDGRRRREERLLKMKDKEESAVTRIPRPKKIS